MSNPIQTSIWLSSEQVSNLCEVNWHGTDSQPIEAGKIHECEAAF